MNKPFPDQRIGRQKAQCEAVAEICDEINASGSVLICLFLSILQGLLYFILMCRIFVKEVKKTPFSPYFFGFQFFRLQKFQVHQH